MYFCILKPRGGYFAFCEGDDYWCDENKLQKQYDAMENHPECGICVCTAQCINEDGSKANSVIPNSPYITHGGYLSQSEIAKAIWGAKASYPFHTSTYFFRRSAITSIMQGTFPCSKYMNRDEAMLRCALAFGGFYYINEIMSCRRQGSIGCWSQRFAASPESEKIERGKKLIYGELEFDKYTNGKFHKQIMQYIANTLCVIGQDSVEKMREKMSYWEIPGFTEKDVLKKCSFKNKILFIIARISPKFFKSMLNAKEKIIH